jgi:hypothetical protein
LSSKAKGSFLILEYQKSSATKNRKKNDTLQTLIESFNAKCNQKDDVYAGVFLWAYNVLLQSLQMTVRKLRDTTTAPR